MTIKVTYNVTDVYVTQDVSPVYINVSYSSGGGSGAAVWGGITGTLSDQTDLQTALDLKVPYTGATQDVNLGEYEIKAGQVTLDTSPTGTAAVGTTRWNDTIGSSETTLKGGNVILKNGVDLVARVVNKVSPNTTLTKAAYQAVRVSGAQGQRLAVALAQANNDANSADTIGLVTETIATNQEGFIMTVGQLENINTTGSLQSETWADGDVLYLSPTTAGAITKVKPTGNGHIVVIGYVEYAHAINGKIYVKVMNGWELDELHDVSITSVANNEGLFYESSSALWKNKSISTVLGYTPEQPLTFNSPLSRSVNAVSIPQATGSVNGFLSATDWTTFNSKQNALGYTAANAATTLTINGVTFDLSANRSWTVSGGISGSGASGQVAYWTGASAQSGSNNLFWDATNSRLGIGTNAPARDIDLVKTSTTNGLVGFGARNLNATGEAFLAAYNDVNQYVAFEVFGSNWTFAPSRNLATVTASTDGGMAFLLFNNNANANFSIKSSTFLTEKLRLYGSTGNLILQNGGTFTDSGERLQVTGTSKFAGNTSVTGGNLSVFNSSAPTINFQDQTGLNNSYQNASFGIWSSSPRAFLINVWGKTSISITSHNFNNTGYSTTTLNSTPQNGFSSENGGHSLVIPLQATIARGLTFQRNDNTLNTNNHDAIRLSSATYGTYTFFRVDDIGNTYARGGAVYGSETSNASAILQADSTTKGFLPPRMTTTQKNAITSPAAGLVVYDTTLNKLCVYTTAWETITSI